MAILRLKICVVGLVAALIAVMAQTGGLRVVPNKPLRIVDPLSVTGHAIRDHGFMCDDSLAGSGMAESPLSWIPGKRAAAADVAPPANAFGYLGITPFGREVDSRKQPEPYVMKHPLSLLYGTT